MISPAPSRRTPTPTITQNSALHHVPVASHMAAFDHAVRLIHGVCCLAGSPTLINNNRRSGGKRLRTAIQDHDTGALFDCLVNDLSYQGIADAVAAKYIAQHGQVTWAELQHKLARRPSCPKLRSYWAFSGCRYDKGSRTCAEPEHNRRCP